MEDGKEHVLNSALSAVMDNISVRIYMTFTSGQDGSALRCWGSGWSQAGDRYYCASVMRSLQMDSELLMMMRENQHISQKQPRVNDYRGYDLK